MTDDLIPIPTLTDTMAAELVGKPVATNLAKARKRAQQLASDMLAKGRLSGRYSARVDRCLDDAAAISLILALPDREALAEMIWNGLMDRGEEPQLAFAHDTADRILSHLKGESSND